MVGAPAYEEEVKAGSCGRLTDARQGFGVVTHSQKNHKTIGAYGELVLRSVTRPLKRRCMNKIVSFIMIFLTGPSGVRPQELPAGTLVYFTITGEFNQQAVWDINLINAPLTAFESKPADLNVNPKLLRKLNDKRFGAFRTAAKEMRITASNSASDLRKWRDKAAPDPPFTFQCDIQIAGDNGLGGQRGGLDIRMTLRSLHPDHDLIYGFAISTLRDTIDPDQGPTVLQMTYGDMLQKCYRDWLEARAANALKPNRRLTLILDMSGLDERQTRFVQYRMLNCIYDRGSGNRYIAGTSDPWTFTITYQLKRFDPDETEAEYLQKYVQKLEHSIGSFGKYECGLRGTPLEDFKPLIALDLNEHSIRIAWQKP